MTRASAVHPSAAKHPAESTGAEVVKSEKTAKLFGNKRLADNTNFAVFTFAAAPKSIPKALETAAHDTWVKEDGSDLFGTGKFKEVKWTDVQKHLADGPEGYDPENDDNNYALFNRAESKGFVAYLKEQAGAGGKVYMAEWDDQSSEWTGSSVVVQTKDPRQFLVANVVTFKM